MAVSSEQLSVSSQQTALCPFCGSETQVMHGSQGLNWYVSCTREGCFDGPFRATEEEAVREYNRLSGAAGRLENVFKIKRDEQRLSAAIGPLEKALAKAGGKLPVIPLTLDVAQELVWAAQDVITLHTDAGKFDADMGGELVAHVHEVVSKKAGVGAQRGTADKGTQERMGAQAHTHQKADGEQSFISGSQFVAPSV